jgi:RNA polymerase sigma-70 factor (ECF subfamily)
MSKPTSAPAAGRYDPNRSSLRVWLFAIARNTLIDFHRRRGRLSFVPVAGADLAGVPGCSTRCERCG